MGGLKASGDMRYFQIRILHEQAQHLPGNILTKFFSKVEMVTGTGVVDSIPTCILRVEHDGVDIRKLKDQLKGSLIIDKILQEGVLYVFLFNGLHVHHVAHLTMIPFSDIILFGEVLFF